jgi:hypothetical protein
MTKDVLMSDPCIEFFIWSKGSAGELTRWLGHCSMTNKPTLFVMQQCPISEHRLASNGVVDASNGADRTARGRCIRKKLALYNSTAASKLTHSGTHSATVQIHLRTCEVACPQYRIQRRI